MKTLLKAGNLLFVSILIGIAFARADEPGVSRPITMDSLLQKMIDRDDLARMPLPAYTLAEASSHDRNSNDPKNFATWHENNDSHQFIRTEVNQGRNEWVIMDATGAGAITRFWTPLWADAKDATIRFYLDGSPTPAISVNFMKFLSGLDFVKSPLAYVATTQTDLRAQMDPNYQGQLGGVGGDLYLPIPYAKSCKVTLDQLPFYYGIDYRTYQEGTQVRSFSMDALPAAKPLIDHVGQVLLAAPETLADDTLKPATLAPGGVLMLNLPPGPHAVRNIEVKIDPAEAEQALRSTIVEATFDGDQTIWCPLSEFFGAGVRLKPVSDWMRTVDQDGTMTAHWVMPYEKSGRLVLMNVGTKPVTVKFGASAGPWRWNDRSMHFHAKWHCEMAIHTRPYLDWNYIEIQGPGVYVGDTLTVFSPAEPWYGEGNEQIYRDGESFPSQIGSGTEDYYGYAWGMAPSFNSPFMSEPRRDAKDPRSDNWFGYTTTSRIRVLDASPFTTSLKFNMEIWDWADTHVDYAVGTFYYAPPGTTDNRTPQPNEARMPIKRCPDGTANIPGAIECETMKIVATSPDTPTRVQAQGLQEGGWSKGQQLFIQTKKIGDFVELEIPAGNDAPHKITLYATKAGDYGIVRFSINGQQAGSDFDAYNERAVASGPIDLGVFTPKDHKYILRAEVVGDKSAAGPGPRYFIGLDCVVLGPP